MRAKQFIMMSYGGMAVYLTLAAIFGFMRDGEHALMFLAGAIVWGIAAFIWDRVHQQGE